MGYSPAVSCRTGAPLPGGLLAPERPCLPASARLPCSMTPEVCKLFGICMDLQGFIVVLQDPCTAEAPNP